MSALSGLSGLLNPPISGNGDAEVAAAKAQRHQLATELRTVEKKDGTAGLDSPSTLAAEKATRESFAPTIKSDKASLAAENAALAAAEKSGDPVALEGAQLGVLRATNALKVDQIDRSSGVIADQINGILNAAQGNGVNGHGK